MAHSSRTRSSGRACTARRSSGTGTVAEPWPDSWGDRHDQLVVDLAVDDLERRLRHDELVGVDVTGHDRLAEAPARVEEELEGVRGDRVGGEQHARRPRTGTSPARRRRGRRTRGRSPACVGRRRPGRSTATPSSAGPRRRTAAAPGDVEVGVLLAGERRARQVLGRRRRPHRHRQALTGLCFERRVGRDDGGFDLGGDRGAREQRADGAGARLDAGRVVVVDVGEDLGDRPGQLVGVEEPAVRRRRHAERGGHRHTCGDELAEVRALAADQREARRRPPRRACGSAVP